MSQHWWIPEHHVDLTADRSRTAVAVADRPDHQPVSVTSRGPGRVVIEGSAVAVMTTVGQIQVDGCLARPPSTRVDGPDGRVQVSVDLRAAHANTPTPSLRSVGVDRGLLSAVLNGVPVIVNNTTQGAPHPGNREIEERLMSSRTQSDTRRCSADGNHRGCNAG